MNTLKKLAAATALIMLASTNGSTALASPHQGEQQLLQQYGKQARAIARGVYAVVDRTDPQQWN